MVKELKYSNTNTYLVKGTKGYLLIDTGWAGTFPAFCKCMGELGIPVQEISHLMITHFHPDHMGIAQEIANLGVQIVVFDVQENFVHCADSVFEKEKNSAFQSIKDANIKIVPIEQSRIFLKEIGLEGEVFHTPGHSEDSVSLYLNEGILFVGDLNPLYELELHKGTEIESTWNRLLNLHPKQIFYGHAKPYLAVESAADSRTEPAAELQTKQAAVSAELQASKRVVESSQKNNDYALVGKIVKLIKKGVSIDKIQKKTGATKELVEDVNRMYLTHQDISIQGILDRIEIKGK